MGRKSAKYLYVGDNQFQRVGLNAPTLTLLEGENGLRFVKGQSFYKKVGYGKHWAWMIWYGGSLIFGLTFALFSIVWLIINRVRKESVFVSSPISWLMLSSLALISFFCFYINILTGEFYHFADKNWKSMALFSLPFSLPVCAIISSLVYFKNIKKISHIILKYYLLLAAKYLDIIKFNF